jgi:hypothetical protein
MELKCLDRPEYIEVGTVPYMDWGYGLSPSYRDNRYPILAIAWGRILQLAVYVNHKSEGDPEIIYDGFYICDSMSIDACYFLSDSLLFVLVNKKEVRILYTQNFTPGIFDDSFNTTSKQNSVGAHERKKMFT